LKFSTAYVTGIYQIRNKVNKKVYIGKSKDVRQRCKNHIKSLRDNQHHNRLLQKDFNKYGEDRFDFTLLIECKENELDGYESAYCHEKDVWRSGYNIAKLKPTNNFNTKEIQTKNNLLDHLLNHTNLKELLNDIEKVEIHIAELSDLLKVNKKDIESFLTKITTDDKEKYQFSYDVTSWGFSGKIVTFRSKEKEEKRGKYLLRKLEEIFR
jgi:group I intron endonuclease